MITANWKSACSGGDCVEVRYTPWRKSTYSNSNGTCVEVRYAPPWRKARASGGGDCVEVRVRKG